MERLLALLFDIGHILTFALLDVKADRDGLEVVGYNG